MKKNNLIFFLLFIVLIFLPLSNISGINVKDTKLLTEPAISHSHIAFVYARDIWICRPDGSEVRRLTSHPGYESNPVFSPDGKLVAFSGEYDGNVDVFVVPAEGGVPRRLTWHPGRDTVRGFTPDGSAVLFISTRDSFTYANNKLYKVSVEGGFPESLLLPRVNKACFSPDGKMLAYTPLREAFHQWKNYRGGTASTIWLYSFSDHRVEKIPQPKGRCNDTDPMWIGSKIYFRSDRNGEFNLFSYDLRTKKITQLTNYVDFPVLNASAGGERIIYEQAGYLHIYEPQKARTKKLTIGVAADLIEVRPRYAKGTRFIRNADISPSGARAVFEFRGEIVTVPAEKGDPRILTNTTGVHERSPAWSPDGKYIAYFSDESGEYELHIAPQNGKGEVKKYALKGAGFYESPVWSPDCQKIAYSDNSWTYYWIDLKKGTVKKIASEYYYGPARWRRAYSVWSPDSKWLIFTLNTKSYFQRVYAYSIEKDKSYPITDGLSDVSDPVFDSSGKYLYFFASTDAGPVKQWFAMSNADMHMTRSIYIAVLRKDIPSPLLKESDEEKGIENRQKKEEEKTNKKNDTSFSIDFEGIEYRILDLPLPPANYWNLRTGKEGEIYYLEAPITQRGPYGKEVKLHKFSLKDRKTQLLGSAINAFLISADKKKMLYLFGSNWGIVPAGSKIKPSQGKIKADAIEVYIDPRAEWKQMFNEAWRINRDYFYDPHMHGADWEAMKKKYEVFLPHCATRDDLNRVIQWMCSELSVGHHRVAGGDFLYQPKRISCGLLGADYTIENGRYCFRKIYGGLNWNPQLRSPLTEPGVNVREGEYLLAVNGKELRPPENLFRRFENTAGKIVEIKVGKNPDGSDARTVSVVPVSNEYTLRNRDWVESNLKKVDEATGGRVAYVYVPNTTTLGHIYFKRYFFPQVHKEAIIIDERFNGGGQVADYYIDHLRRPFVCYWHTRYGHDIKTPGGAIHGPKVMLINESAGSGGDLLPWMFRKFKLGKLIGKRTWGGLVGILGFPVLMDGGYVTAPNLAIWTEDGWVVENVGVPPDIEVEQIPADVIAGKDPQLEKAIEVVMEELRKNPPRKIERPPFPVRVKKK
ncbi:MAG: PDZ domain-containing protein [Candidatus Aminicenantales bacterium]